MMKLNLNYMVAAVLCMLWIVNSVLAEKDFYEILDVTREATTREIRKAFKKIALTEHPDKRQDDPDAHEKFLRINRAYEVLKDDELRKKFDTYGEEGLKDDAPTGRGYQSWKFYKQEFGIYDNDEEIVTLSKSDFEQIVENTADVWFINFYSPHCSHCHTLAPAWREVARELEGVIRIGAVNCQDDWMLCRSKGIRSYPSLLMFPQREKYHGERTRKDLVKHALQQVNSQVYELWEQNYETTLVNNENTNGKPWLITFCGDGGDCLGRMTLIKLSVMLADLANIGQIDCFTSSPICEKLNIEHGTHFFPPDEVIKGKNMEITSLDTKEVAYSVLEQLPDMTEFDEKSFQELREKVAAGEEPDWLVHFVESDERNLELRKLPALLQGFHVGRVDCRQFRKACNDLHIFKPPRFVLFRQAGGHEVHHGRVTAHDIAAFAREVSQASVQTLSPSDFPGRVMENNDVWFVDFFAPWCPPCMKLLPEFRKASRQIDKVHFGTVDCTLHNKLCKQYNIHSYPTTVIYNHSQPHHYHGRHSADAIIEFLEDTMKPPVIVLNPDSFFDNVEMRAPDELWLIDFFAPWCGPCQQLAPEWRRLAKMVNDEEKLKVAQVDCAAHQALCQEQGVRSYPSVRLYPQGKGTKNFKTYQGWHRDAHNLKAWAYEYMPSLVTPLSTQRFNDEVVRSSDPWLVDFYTPWCSHCKVFAPELEKVAKKLEDRLRTAKVDCDQNQMLCRNAGVRAYPTVRFYKGVSSHGTTQSYYGEEIDSQSANEIIEFLNKRLSRHKVLKRDEL